MSDKAENTTKIEENLEEELPENPSDEEFEQKLKGEIPVAEKIIAAKKSEEDAVKYKEEIKDLEDKYMRAAAEMQNQRRRFDRELDDTRKYAISGFARDMIAVMENLHRAQESVTEEQKAENEFLKKFCEGVNLTANELLHTFKKHGIERIDPIDQKYDHNFHQAMMEVETADKEPGTVVQVMQAGYIIKDRLLRPAMVAVAKAASQSAQEESGD